jgi:hypothetical protein
MSRPPPKDALSVAYDSFRQETAALYARYTQKGVCLDYAWGMKTFLVLARAVCMERKRYMELCEQRGDYISALELALDACQCQCTGGHHETPRFKEEVRSMVAQHAQSRLFTPGMTVLELLVTRLDACAACLERLDERMDETEMDYYTVWLKRNTINSLL